MVELVQSSAPGNIRDLRRKGERARQQLAEEIEQAFLDASRNPSLIHPLAEKLRRNGLWERYEDRFFALVKASSYNFV